MGSGIEVEMCVLIASESLGMEEIEKVVDRCATEVRKRGLKRMCIFVSSASPAVAFPRLRDVMSKYIDLGIRLYTALELKNKMNEVLKSCASIYVHALDTEARRIAMSIVGEQRVNIVG